MPMGLKLNKEIAMNQTLSTYHMIMPKDLNPRGPYLREAVRIL